MSLKRLVEIVADHCRDKLFTYKVWHLSLNIACLSIYFCINTAPRGMMEARIISGREKLRKKLTTAHTMLG
jgi:hypothetical protein